MKSILELLQTGPVIVGEVRGAKSEVIKRFDKSDKNAPPQLFGIYKVQLELLIDGAPVQLTVFLDGTTDAEAFAERMGLKRGDVVAAIVSRVEQKNGSRRVSCSPADIHRLDASEVAAIRSAGTSQSGK
jgi:hypothetical protein